MKTISAALLFTCILNLNSVNAQQKLDVNQAINVTGQNMYYSVNGEPFSSAKFSKVVDGTPFFRDEFMKASVILSDGKTYNNLSVKVNLMDGTIVYLNDKNEELEATSNNIKAVEVIDVMTNAKAKFLHSSMTCIRTGNKWFKVLDSGKVQLLRYEKKVLKETKPYASATAEQHILDDPEYYLLTDTDCIRIKNASDLTKQLALLNSSFKAEGGSKKKAEPQMVEMVKEFNRQ
ncbi:hypothetical protein [Pollutibacter soli]|uniref:hypothetical protein n=1 Tax=Pollutibacter soli TaxID=3034157 RepID=UPI003013A25A